MQACPQGVRVVAPYEPIVVALVKALTHRARRVVRGTRVALGAGVWTLALARRRDGVGSDPWRSVPSHADRPYSVGTSPRRCRPPSLAWLLPRAATARAGGRENRRQAAAYRQRSTSESSRGRGRVRDRRANRGSSGSARRRRRSGHPLSTGAKNPGIALKRYGGRDGGGRAFLLPTSRAACRRASRRRSRGRSGHFSPPPAVGRHHLLGRMAAGRCAAASTVPGRSQARPRAAELFGRTPPGNCRKAASVKGGSRPAGRVAPEASAFVRRSLACRKRGEVVALTPAQRAPTRSAAEFWMIGAGGSDLSSRRRPRVVVGTPSPITSAIAPDAARASPGPRCLSPVARSSIRSLVHLTDQPERVNQTILEFLSAV